MRIRFEETGGIAFFPGLNKPTTLDSDQMTEEEAGQLTQLVEAARFFTLPASLGAPHPGAADYKQYSISIEDGQQSHTVKLTDPVTDANLSALLNFIRAKVRAARVAQRPPPAA